MKFWFYCDEEDPVDFPEAKVLWTVMPSKEYSESKIGPYHLAKLENILKLYEDCREIFWEHAKSIGIERCEDIFKEDFNSFSAKDIPKMRKLLLEQGWEEDYIPFGP